MTRVAATPDAVFRARKDQELANLRSLLSGLNIAPEEATQEIKDRFEQQIANCVRQIDREAMDTTTLREILDSKIRPVVTEVQDYLYAVLYRQAGLDNGVGAVAHWMLNDIARRAGVERRVLLSIGEAELIEHTFSMIRMRHQDASVWRLPILVHELGHHVARNLRDVNPNAFAMLPVKTYLEDARDAREHRHLHELFADVFATYVLGAAYPTCVIIQQARPDQGFHDHDQTHPSWPARVHIMLGALRAMSAIDPKDVTAGAFAQMADLNVEPLWSALTAESAGSADPPTQPELRALPERAAELVDLLVRHAPARLRFRFGRAYDLSRDLTSRDDPALPEGATITQVLDAAWRWRANNLSANDNDLTIVSRNALRWCEASTH
ncbi:MAG: hypothetical protein QOH69_273 [Actinomycetota bacterium]|jgi:hypothetical protein|nr:hypothetical protein [Mycobacterium sp.]MDQ1545369.1 hypothetical protein [Actinomycetota bacterium]